MALSIVDQNTLTTDGTEQSVVTVSNSQKALVFRADFGAAVGGATPDIFVVRIKTNVRSGGTERLQHEASFIGGLMVNPIYEVIFAIGDDCTVTIEKTQGTNRDIPWMLLEAV